MSYSFHWNPHFKRKRKAGLQRAQRAIDSSVLRFSEPFLPFQSGVLRNSGITGTVVGSGRVQWTAPYAHYLYEGRVMGPNVPLHEGGQLVGFFSPKAPKKYTGKKLQFHGAPKRGADTTSLPWSAQGTRRIGLKTTTFWSPWRAGWRIRKIKGTIQNCPDVIPWKGSRFSMPRSTMFLRTGRGCIKYKSN